MRDGMPTEEAARRYYIELGWSEAEACEKAASVISDTTFTRWQDSLD
jgi:hypothetical protein